MSSLFTRILNKEIPSEMVYENENLFVIKDINPEDTTHLLIIPKEEIESINNLEEKHKELMGDMFLTAKKIAKELGINEGYKLIVNTGDYQDIPHIHMHLISRRG
ncbi:MAG: HIT domain-containing protein [Candidatus Gracilibacteria bacterium]|nr:HIT domain-containing protein [Candidatus Gracilibacteria bacterium]